MPLNFKVKCMKILCHSGHDYEQPLSNDCILSCMYQGFRLCLQLASSRGIEGLTNLDVFLVAREVEQSLACHDTSKCLSWCHDNKSKLRKLNSSLEFNVRMQEFIELIRGDRRMDAIRWVTSHCDEKWTLASSVLACFLVQHSFIIFGIKCISLFLDTTLIILIWLLRTHLPFLVNV